MFQSVLCSLILHHFPNFIGKVIDSVPFYSQMDPLWVTNYTSLYFHALRDLVYLASMCIPKLSSSSLFFLSAAATLASLKTLLFI